MCTVQSKRKCVLREKRERERKRKRDRDSVRRLERHRKGVYV